MKKIILFTILSTASLNLFGAEDGKLSFRFRSLVDMSVSSYHYDQPRGYFKLEDFRVGFKIPYKNFDVKTDIGISESGVAIKDLLFSYYFGNSTIALGNGYEPYSMDMLISTTDLRFHQSATSALAFTNSRKFGLTYHLNKDHLYWGIGLYTNNDINKFGADMINSMVGTSRLVVRTDQQSDVTLHLGAAYSHQTKPTGIGDRDQTITSNGVTSMFRTPLLKASWNDWDAEQKAMVEVLAIWPRVMIQGEYFMNRYKREGGNYMPHGGYIHIGLLLIGKGFNYDRTYAIPGRPISSRALELAARYNYTNLNDIDTSIYGGEEYDISIGLNFYFNQHFGIKLNGSYLSVGEGCNSFYSKDLWMCQFRAQYIF